MKSTGRVKSCSIAGAAAIEYGALTNERVPLAGQSNLAAVGI